jgi:hypothetical protein
VTVIGAIRVQSLSEQVCNASHGLLVIREAVKKAGYSWNQRRRLFDKISINVEEAHKLNLHHLKRLLYYQRVAELLHELRNCMAHPGSPVDEIFKCIKQWMGTDSTDAALCKWTRVLDTIIAFI